MIFVHRLYFSKKIIIIIFEAEMKKLFLILLMVTIPVLICNAEEPDGINWKRVAPNNYIDPDGITGTQDRYGFSFIIVQ